MCPHLIRDCGEERGYTSAKIHRNITEGRPLPQDKSPALCGLSHHAPGGLQKPLELCFSMQSSEKYCSHLLQALEISISNSHDKKEVDDVREPKEIAGH